MREIQFRKYLKRNSSPDLHTDFQYKKMFFFLGFFMVNPKRNLSLWGLACLAIFFD